MQHDRARVHGAPRPLEALTEQLGVLLGYAGLVLIVAGEFTRHAVPRLKDIAMVAEGVGWISFVLTQIVLTQRAAERNGLITVEGVAAV